MGKSTPPFEFILYYGLGKDWTHTLSSSIISNGKLNKLIEELPTLHAISTKKQQNSRQRQKRKQQQFEEDPGNITNNNTYNSRKFFSNDIVSRKTIKKICQYRDKSGREIKSYSYEYINVYI